LHDDYVGLWTLAWHLRRALSDAPDELVIALAEAILDALLRFGVVLGDLDGTTGAFLPWSPTGALEAAMTAWRSLGRDPNIGEIAWLDLPS
jgi:hypothetical protein